MKFKKCLLTVGLSLLMSVSAFADINITVDNQKLNSDVSPVIVEGRTLVPVRAIFEELGADVNWDADTQTVTATKNGLNISLQINNKSAVVNNENKTLDVPAQIVDGRTMVPARFVAESMGCNVGWDSDTQTVTISTENSATEQQPNTEPSNNQSSANTETSTVQTERKVYITKTGSKYHFDSNCGNGTYYETTMEEALNLGLTPCKKCAY